MGDQGGGAYAVVNGLQYVRPHEAASVYRVRKERHQGLPDEEVLADMFPQGRPCDDGSVEASVAHWRRELGAGRVEVIPASDGDFRQLVVTRHMHEQPVVAAECSVLHEDEKLLVVSKPAGMPTLNEIQGVGKNTALGVLQHRLGDTCKLIPMHRLDKPVSGVLLFVKTVEGQQVRDPLVRKIQKHITQHKVQKTYVARVLGSFPEAPVSCTAPLQWCEGSDRGTASVSHESGKASETRFSLIQREGSTSLVSCLPITGRPHQIRAHLQHLGYPIANDEQYGGMRQQPSASAIYSDDSELVHWHAWLREPVNHLYVSPVPQNQGPHVPKSAGYPQENAARRIPRLVRRMSRVPGPIVVE